MKIYYEYKTPCGEIVIKNGKNEKIPFSLVDNECNEKYSEISALANYVIKINTKDLKLNEKYYITIDGCKLQFFDCDAMAEALTGSCAGYSIGLGDFDLNEEEKYKQWDCWNGSYDNPKFEHFFVERTQNDDGFEFYLIDKNFEFVTFFVAWIQNEKDKEEFFEDACSYWVNYFSFDIINSQKAK